MVHALQVREYPLVLCFLVYNALLFCVLLNSVGIPGGWRFWLVAMAYCLSSAGAFYTTRWAPFFLWPQAVVALCSFRRNRRAVFTVLSSLAVAALLCLPSIFAMPRNSLVFALWDKRPPTFGLLLARLRGGTLHLLIGSQLAGHALWQIYYWSLVVILGGALLIFGYRLFRERSEIQYIVLTVLGFLTFQIAYFFLREPLSTWPRYFILYLPYVALLIPLSFSRLVVSTLRPAARSWAYMIFFVIVAVAGGTQIKNNYQNPYVDHGPDFREVYRYLIVRVAPRDKIVVGLMTNRMALNYYWPSPKQIQLRYTILPSDQSDPHPSIWTVSYQDLDSQAFRDYARGLESMGYREKGSKVISNVTVRQFVRQHADARL